MDEPLYFADRTAQRLRQSGVGALQREPVAESEDLSWLVGEWSMNARILATPLSPERAGKGTARVAPDIGGGWLAIRKEVQGGPGQEVAFVTHNPAAGQWTFVWLVTWRNTFTAFSPGWESDRLVFTAQPAWFYGEPVRLRVVLTRLGDDAFSLVYEEERTGGRWVPIDEYLFHRQTPEDGAATGAAARSGSVP